MSTSREIVIFVCALICAQHGVSSAIDYNPTWDFTLPIGAQQLPWLQGSDYLTYNVTTGNLVYHVGGDGNWSPPDVGSLSGLLDMSVLLHPVPLSRPPVFREDESFGGVVVPGSNAIRIGFDRYLFWPWSPEDPEILQSYGLDRAPDVYSYGAILPAGLAKVFLQTDLFATTFPQTAFDLRVVPEPGAFVSLAIVAVIITTHGALTRRKRATADGAPQ